MSLDPVTLAVLKGRLEQIADEMDATLYRSAFNPIIAEARDACHGLYHRETGDTLVQGTKGLPIFVGAMAFAVKAVIEKVKAQGGLKPGDTFIFNDPYAGGTHLNDFRLVRPVFRDGALFCWLASAGHWLDVGGNVPGGYNPVATESFQEGVLIPVVKLIAGGETRQDVLDILAANSRLPNSNWGDLNGQLNALDLGEKRLQALLGDYGQAVIEEAFDAFSARAEALMREAIAALPDGTYAFEDYLDNDGIVDERLTVALDLTISGETMVLDFSRSSPPCAGPINISTPTTIAACYVALKHVFTDVPANAGCLKPITFVVPDTTLLGRQGPEAHGGLYRDHPAPHRRGLRRARQGCPRAGDGRAFRHDQRALHGRPPRQWQPLGHVQLLRRRSRRQSRERRPQPRQQSDLDGHHAAGRDPRGSISRHVHAVGASPGFRRRGGPSRRPRRHL